MWSILSEDIKHNDSYVIKFLLPVKSVNLSFLYNI